MYLELILVNTKVYGGVKDKELTMQIGRVMSAISIQKNYEDE